MKLKSYVAAFFAAGLALGALAASGMRFLSSAPMQMLLVAVLVCVLVWLGLRRTRAYGRIDPFHPLAFPLMYVAFSFLAPMWMAIVHGNPVGSLARPTSLAPNTVILLTLGVAGFAAAAVVRFTPPIKAPLRTDATTNPRFATTLLQLGRLLLLIPIALSGRAVLEGAVNFRGIAQVQVGVSDTLSSLLGPVSTAAVALILSAHRLRGAPALLARTDWILVATLLALTAASGNRGTAIALLLLLTVVRTSMKRSVKPALLGVAVMLGFSLLVLDFRVAAVGGEIERTVDETILGDLAVAGFTTGATAALVPDLYPYADGGTLVAALTRQLPSPIAIPLLGPPDDAGARTFRKLISLENQNQGVGFSLPAEGYLNFGPPGVFLLCGAFGLLFAWAYPRMNLAGGRVNGLVYPILVATMPLGLRSDVLGLTKGILYPVIIIGVAIVLARSVARSAPSASRAARLGPGSAPHSAIADHRTRRHGE